jgi:LCP family protein required for cell wall assembly
MRIISIFLGIFLFLGLILGGLYLSGSIDLQKFFAPVSVVSKVIGDGELKKTDGKTNILILGVDRRSPGNSVQTYLTDSIMVVSLDATSGKAAMISIPRDLWVEKYRTKINSVYTLSGRDINEVKAAVERVVGIPIHYHAIVGFDVFKDSIDSIGGVQINVANAFDDYEYPIEGKENAEPESARYEHVSFKEGLQTMNGETALKYARSRHSVNPIEAGDFARARRQQIVLEAVKDKIISSETLLNPSKMVGIYESLKNNVQTDMDTADFILFFKEYKSMKFDQSSIAKIVLSNENSDNLGAGTLKAPDAETRQQLYNGAYVLVPTSGTYEEIQSLVREVLFK